MKVAPLLPPVFLLVMLTGCGAHKPAPSRVAVEERRFVLTNGAHSRPFTPWGFNYDRTVVGGQDMLLEDVLREHPRILDEDFAAMRRVGGNTVRVLLGTTEILADGEHVDPAGLKRLDLLLCTAEKHGLRLILTGLATLRPASIPAWMQAASDEQMERAEVFFWQTVARRCRGREAIFAYDLQNEPVINWADSDRWMDGCFTMSQGQQFCYCHRHYRHVRSRWTRYVQAAYGTETALRQHWPDYPRTGESWSAIAIPVFDAKDSRFAEYFAWHGRLWAEWAGRLAAAVRAEDDGHLVTVGALDPNVMAGPVDFYCYHLYPKTVGPGEDYLAANAKYLREKIASVPRDKPLVIEEFYPMWTPGSVKAADMLATLLEATRDRCSGWISFYWGDPQRTARPGDAARSAHESWLKVWSREGMGIQGRQLPGT